MVPSITVYHHPRCGTCKKAINYLNQRNLSFKLIDLTLKTPSVEILRQLADKCGKEKITQIFNTSGKVYRENSYKEKIKMMSIEEILNLLENEGMLIKRPIIIFNKQAISGFKQEAWDKLLF